MSTEDISDKGSLLRHDQMPEYNRHISTSHLLDSRSSRFGFHLSSHILHASYLHLLPAIKLLSDHKRALTNALTRYRHMIDALRYLV